MTIGSWLLAFNATHYDDRRLCEQACSPSSLAVYDMPQCAGLCDAAAQLPQLHASDACRLPATGADGTLPLARPLFWFGGEPADAGSVAKDGGGAAGRRLQEQQQQQRRRRRQQAGLAGQALPT